MIRTLLSRLLRVGTYLLGMVLLLSGCPSVPTVVNPATTTSSPSQVTALGRIEPRDGIVLVNAPPGEQILDVLVGQGDKVKAGQKLLVLRSEKLRSKEKELARAQLDAVQKQQTALGESGRAQVREAELKRDNLVASAGTDIATLSLKVGLLKAQYQAAKEEMERKDRAPESVYSEPVKVSQRLAAKAALVDWQSTELVLEQSKKSLELKREEAEARIQALKKSLEQAESQLSVEAARINQQLARMRYDASLIQSPIAGDVLEVSIHKGDFTGPQPLMRLADLGSLVVIAEVDQSDVLRISDKDSVHITSSVLKESLGIKQLDGTVKSIGKMIAPNKLNSLNPAARSDRRVVEVTIELRGLQELKPKQREGLQRTIGLQVNVEIDATPIPGPDNEK